MKCARIALTAFLFLSACSPSPAPAPQATPVAAAPVSAASQPAETKEQRDARMKWWREARFGMFIHWGVYSVPAGVYQGRNISGIGEWIMNSASIPVAEYRKYVEQFNPTKFNADEFVAVAKNAGMKYIVITSKHHDGFAMFKSQDPFNIVDATPFKRDVIQELSVAARKQGIHFGVYYSQSQDWNHPGGYAAARNNRRNGEHWDPAQEGSFDDYINKVAVPQVRELLTKYQPEVLWFDTAGPITHDQATRLHDLLALRSGIIINNRLRGGYSGDTETPEQTIPANGYPGRDWETCMTINGTWGYKSTDTNWKSTQTLLRNLIDIASKGGNYLLNVGPTAEGIIPEPEVERLAEMGKWLKVNGEAIYGTGPTPFGTEAGTYAPPATTTAPNTTAGRASTQPRWVPAWNWRATTKPGQIYVHIFQWPASGAWDMPAPKGAVTKAYLLADPTHAALPVDLMEANGQRRLLIKVPDKPLDPIATVMCLDLAGG